MMPGWPRERARGRPGRTPQGPPRRGSLARQLLWSQLAVVAAMAVTASVVAAVLGPPLFERHMLEAGHAAQPDVLQHGEEAFVSAGLVALAVGLTIALLGAVLATTWVTRRLGDTVGELHRGAARVAAGDYSAPVALGDGAHELRAVASSLNALARRVGDTEATRRRVLTDLSHELRTPIATLGVLLEALEDGVAPWDADARARLREQVTRLERLAADMRDVSTFEEGRLGLRVEPLSLREVLGAALEPASRQFTERQVSLLVGPVPDVVVAADRVRLVQVLDNLLRNARQHTPSGGHVRVDVETDAAAVRVLVRDDGAGMTASEVPHVFERFFRGDPERRHDEGAGTGVGLTISRAIAEAHGGRLEAESPGPGLGSTFTLTLPRPHAES